MRTIVTILFLIQIAKAVTVKDNAAVRSYTYNVAQMHEVKPHRLKIPVSGVRRGFHELHLALVISATGAVKKADPQGDKDDIGFWPSVRREVEEWRFIPFKKSGSSVEAHVEEYVVLVPPERLPRKHLEAPVIRPGSQLTIRLKRTGCYGTCPAYSVTIPTSGVVFEGSEFVAVTGRHTARVDAGKLRILARQFLDADFYSMDPAYIAAITDSPTYFLSFAIDGRVKSVKDYLGSSEGMPSVITQLEEQTDSFARSERWIQGSAGLVQALIDERFNFGTFEAQTILREAASRGQTVTVQELLKAGVPLKPISAVDRLWSKSECRSGQAHNHREPFRGAG